MITDFYIGDDLVIFFPAATDALGNVVDLTGATLACSVRTGTADAILADSTSIDLPATDGKCRALFGATATAGFTANATYTYFGVVTLSGGEVHTVGKGEFRARVGFETAAP
jgi:hypothetical protein